MLGGVGYQVLPGLELSARYPVDLNDLDKTKYVTSHSSLLQFSMGFAFWAKGKE